MSSTPSTVDPRLAWRQELPVLAGQSTTLREPTPADFEGVLEVLLTAESVRFGLDGEASDEAILALIAQMQDERTTGRAFTYLVTLATSGRGRSWRNDLGLRVRAVDAVVGIVAGLCAQILISVVYAALGIEAEGPARQMVAKGDGVGGLIGLVVLLAVAAPVVEAASAVMLRAARALPMKAM